MRGAPGRPSLRCEPAEACAVIPLENLADPVVLFVMAWVRQVSPASLRAFAKAGFRKDREFDDVSHGLHVLLVRHRRGGQAA